MSSIYTQAVDGIFDYLFTWEIGNLKACSRGTAEKVSNALALSKRDVVHDRQGDGPGGPWLARIRKTGFRIKSISMVRRASLAIIGRRICTRIKMEA